MDENKTNGGLIQYLDHKMNGYLDILENILKEKRECEEIEMCQAESANNETLNRWEENLQEI